MTRQRFGYWKDIAETMQYVVTVAAIIVGGVWAYKGFVEQRLGHPRLQIVQKVSHVRLSPDYNLLTVDETLTNTGTVLLRLREGGVRVIKVLPLTDALRSRVMLNQHLADSDKGHEWQLLEDRSQTWAENDEVIEPGESDQLHSEFLLPSDVEVVTVNSYARNPTVFPQELFWRAISMYDFRERAPKGDTGQ